TAIAVRINDSFVGFIARQLPCIIGARSDFPVQSANTKPARRKGRSRLVGMTELLVPARDRVTDDIIQTILGVRGHSPISIVTVHSVSRTNEWQTVLAGRFPIKWQQSAHTTTVGV